MSEGCPTGKRTRTFGHLSDTLRPWRGRDKPGVPPGRCGRGEVVPNRSAPRPPAFAEHVDHHRGAAGALRPWRGRDQPGALQERCGRGVDVDHHRGVSHGRVACLRRRSPLRRCGRAAAASTSIITGEHCGGRHRGEVVDHRRGAQQSRPFYVSTVGIRGPPSRHHTSAMTSGRPRSASVCGQAPAARSAANSVNSLGIAAASRSG